MGYVQDLVEGHDCGLCLRVIMAARGLSVNKIAEDFGFSGHSSICHYRSTKRWTRDSLKMFCLYLEMTEKEFLSAGSIVKNKTKRKPRKPQQQ